MPESNESGFRICRYEEVMELPERWLQERISEVQKLQGSGALGCDFTRKHNARLVTSTVTVLYNYHSKRVGTRELELLKTRYVSQLELAEAAAQANHKVEALGHLERAYQDHEPMMVRLLYNPALDPLHEESRFKELVKKIGLPGAK